MFLFSFAEVANLHKQIDRMPFFKQCQGACVKIILLNFLKRTKVSEHGKKWVIFQWVRSISLGAVPTIIKNSFSIQSFSIQTTRLRSPIIILALFTVG